MPSPPFHNLSGVVMVSSLALFFVAGGIAPSLRPSARADRGDYVGSAQCGTCHPSALTSHKRSAHAVAARSVSATRSRSCDRCHRTGDAPLGDVYFDEVGCEACHGPGAAYASEDVMRDPALARLLGLRELSTPEARRELCSDCHRPPSTRVLPFAPETAYKRIEHR